MQLRQILRNLSRSMTDRAQNLDNRVSKKNAVRHLLIFDLGIVRSVWRNLAQIAPDVYRSNQPSPEWLVRYARRGIRTVVTLRGASNEPQFLLEERQSRTLGLTLLSVEGFTAHKAPSRETLLTTLDTLRTAQKPLLFHCKTGSGRTSLAAAIYLLAEQGASIKQARKQFSLRFVHFKWTAAGVLDHILDTYEAEHIKSGISFEDWLRTSYDADAVQSEFDSS